MNKINEVFRGMNCSLRDKLYEVVNIRIKWGGYNYIWTNLREKIQIEMPNQPDRNYL